MAFDTILTALQAKFADLATSQFRDNRRVIVKPPQLFDVLTLLAEFELVAPGGWIVVEQSKRAPAAPPAPTAHERAFVATLGDHRIAFYRRPHQAPSAE